MIRFVDLCFSYHRRKNSPDIIKNLNMQIHRQEMVAIQGTSGSGKPTLMYLLGGLLKPRSGKIFIQNLNIADLSSDQTAVLRTHHVGFIFQHFHLLPRETALGNILLPCFYASDGLCAEERELKARTLAERFGITEQLGSFPNQLSGGQQQRVAIARALMNDPEIILADEPTGNLDSKSSASIMQILKELNQTGKTVVIITHDPEVAEHCARKISFKDGVIVQDTGESLNTSMAKEDLKKSSLRPEEKLSLEKFKRYTWMALENLRRNKMRTGLTMLGVTLGIAALLSTISIGNFSKKKIIEGYASLGVNTLVFYGQYNWDLKATDAVPKAFRNFDWDIDLLPLKKHFPQIKMISPMMIGQESTVSFNGKTLGKDPRAFGVSEELLRITNRELLSGRFLTTHDIKNKNSVCVIGPEIAKKFFTTIEALGKILQFTQDEATYSCTVIGILKPSKSNRSWYKEDYQIIIPFTYFQSINTDFFNEGIHDVLMLIDDKFDMEKTGIALKAYFTQKYGKSGWFETSSDSILIAQMKRFFILFTGTLASIAILTLLVGSIGITNMMLVSVAERFREIGLRKALGATNDSIRLQLLAESVLTCLIAGLIGALIGFIVCNLAVAIAAKYIPQVHFEWIFDWIAFLVSFVFIFAVGVLSGIFPAKKAQSLQVIEALRSE